MGENTYLNWVSENTKTKWWHDSAAEAELDLGLQRGAVGATTNPVLASAALKTHRDHWAPEIDASSQRTLRLAHPEVKFKFEYESGPAYISQQQNPHESGRTSESRPWDI